MGKDSYHFNRIVVSAFVFVTHLTQLISISIRSKELLPTHPELVYIQKVGMRYCTIWNVLLQIAYAAFSMTCDLTEVFGYKWIVPNWLRKYRYILFSGLIFPAATLVLLVFWPIYFYDRRSILPPASDLVLTTSHNLMSHLGVFLYVLWETAHLPRECTKHGPWPFKHSVVYIMVYTFVTLYTRYGDLGIWCYDFMAKTEGTIYLYLLFLYCISACIFGYFVQWKIKDVLWSFRQEKKEN